MNKKNLSQKEKYMTWVTENLGGKTGGWYAPYIEKLGYFLNKFELESSYKENFFAYQEYDEFKKIYQQMTKQSDEEVQKLVSGKGTPRYPKEFGMTRIKFIEKYAEYEYKKGLRRKAENLGGIPDWGTLMRSYLIFLYYDEHVNLIYTRKDKKVMKQEEEIDNSINYWIISPGENSKKWNEFYLEKMIAIGWDYLGDLKAYSKKEDIERKISEQRADGIRPINDTKAVWDFYHEIKIGDVIYVKGGLNKILAFGIVVGEYDFNEYEYDYKHRRNVNWIKIGDWETLLTLPSKALTRLNDYPNYIQEIKQLLDDEFVDLRTAEINEFRNWLSNQVTKTGINLNEKTITQKVNALKDIESHFNLIIFGESDSEQLKQLKDIIISADSYQKYKGVSASSIDYYIRFIESKPIIQENESFTMKEFLSEVFITKNDLNRLISLLENKKNLILKGAPGVGKTFIAKRLSFLMMQEKDETRVQTVQFHQSYSYEDFIEGFRPKAEGDGFELKQGPFVKFARKAARDPERDYFFIIDEINRGNLSKILGELMVLIECDKRNEQINLLYSNDKFSVPDNLYIIGMMNTADRSLALLDYALRRRFSFFEINPAFKNETFISYLKKLDDPEILMNTINEINNLNDYIIEELGTGFQIGHSYFVGDSYKVNTLNRIEEVIEYEIIPQLLEYWFDDEKKAKEWAERLRGIYNGKKS